MHDRKHWVWEQTSWCLKYLAQWRVDGRVDEKQWLTLNGSVERSSRAIRLRNMTLDTCSVTAWIMSGLRVQAGKDKWPPTYKAWERVCRPNPGTRVEFSCCSSFCCCWERSLALTSYIASFYLRLALNRPYKPCFFWGTTVGRIENLRHGSFQKEISRFINYCVL